MAVISNFDSTPDDGGKPSYGRIAAKSPSPKPSQNPLLDDRWTDENNAKQ
jgi:hypothetical protein